MDPVLEHFFGGGGKSLWGTTTASCMSMRLQIFKVLSMRLYRFLGEGGENSRAPTLCVKPCCDWLHLSLMYRRKPERFIRHYLMVMNSLDLNFLLSKYV